jgi:hypothetical protein
LQRKHIYKEQKHATNNPIRKMKVKKKKIELLNPIYAFLLWFIEEFCPNPLRIVDREEHMIT